MKSPAAGAIVFILWILLVVADACEPARLAADVAGAVIASGQGPDSWQAWMAWGPRCRWRDAATADRQRAPDACGAAALAHLLQTRTPQLSQELLWSLSRLPDGGTSLARLVTTARRFGHAAEARFDPRLEDLPLPVIVHLRRRHFVVLVQRDASTAEVLDPACGLLLVPWEVLLRQASGAALTLLPPPAAGAP